jgi:hypothetical protein
MTAKTTDQSLEEACALPENAATEVQRLLGEEARLRLSDPATEERLQRTAASLEAAAAELTRLTSVLGADAESSLRALGTTAAEKRTAANVASSGSFEDEPLSGVGGATWRALWEAARRFSETVAYPKQRFPVTHADAHCVLCQQPLPDEASQRLNRFQIFMIDDTQSQAEKARQEWQRALAVVRRTHTLTPRLAVHLEALAEAFGPLVEEVRTALATFEKRRVALASLGDAAPTEPPDAPSEEIASTLTAGAATARQTAQSIDSTQVTAMLAGVVNERRSLEAQQALADAKRSCRQGTRRLRSDVVKPALGRLSTTGDREYGHHGSLDSVQDSDWCGYPRSIPPRADLRQPLVCRLGQGEHQSPYRRRLVPGPTRVACVVVQP